ncbi:PAS domain S-box protein [candidate division WOR-3 bacterium]|nr:PAS domain S-box protein [candidate division WOR-3 bacterium]
MIKDKFLTNSKKKVKDTKNESNYSILEDEGSLSLIFDSSPYPIFLLDRQGIIEDINSAAIKLLKFDRNKIKGKSFTELLESDSKKLFNDEFHILSKKRKAKRKLNLIFKDKKDININCSALIVSGKNKRNGKSVLFAQDMTELEKTQKAFHFKNELLNSLLDNIPDLIYFKDKKSRFVELSKSKAKQVGLSKEKVIGKTDFDYFTKEHAEQAYRDEQEIIKTGKEIKSKVEKETHPDGRITWVSTTKIPRYDEKGKVIGSLGISRDVTDQVVAEKGLEESANKLKTIVNAVSEGLAIVDEKHVILEANEFLSKLFALKREDIIGKKCNLIFGPWEETCENCPLEKLFKNREDFPVVEKTRVSKNGTIRYFNIQCYPISNKASENPKSVISIRDITERKNMEKKNIQNYKRKMKNLSHKLTLAEEHERKRIATTLHAEVGQTLAFLTLKMSELKGKEYPKNIKEELEEVYDLAQKAMTSTRLLMRQLSPAILYELGFVPAVDWIAEHLLRESNIRYTFKDDGEEKPLTDDLSILLFQAVREILVNVIKHSRAKNVNISVKRCDNNIQIEIIDDGIGFDTSTLDSYVEKDIGFGLLNIRSRIDVVGGHFEIESNKNKGTTVKLEAPLEK